MPVQCTYHGTQDCQGRSCMLTAPCCPITLSPADQSPAPATDPHLHTHKPPYCTTIKSCPGIPGSVIHCENLPRECPDRAENNRAARSEPAVGARRRPHRRPRPLIMGPAVSSGSGAAPKHCYTMPAGAAWGADRTESVGGAFGLSLWAELWAVRRAEAVGCAAG